MYQWFAVAVHGRDECRHILQIRFGGHALAEVCGVAALHPAAIRGVVDDFANTQRYVLPRMK